jgi:AraC-like DNA-binding protein
MGQLIDIVWVVKAKNDIGYLPHSHDFFQLCYSTNGLGLIMTDDEYEIRADDVYVIAPGVTHSLAIKSKEHQESIEIKFSLPKGELYDMVAALPTVIHCPGVKQLICNAYNEIVGGASRHVECAEHYTLLALYHLLRAVNSETVTSNHDADPLGVMSAGDIVSCVRTYVESNLSQKFSLDSIAHISGYAKAYLCRIFKQECGMTIMEYYNVMRIKAAQRMLGDCTRSLSEISDALGFENTNHFSRVFKKIVRMPPGAYRKRFCESVNFGISVKNDYINPDYLVLHQGLKQHGTV